MNIDEEIRFFDEFQSEHGDYDVLTEATYERLLRAFADRVRPQPGQICIDLGCGTGAFTRRLLRYGLTLTGVDISTRNVVRAAGTSLGERYLVGDIRKTPFPDACADVITYSGVLHHVPDDESRVGVLREGLRILKPGGSLFAFDPNAGSPSMFLFRDPRSPLFSSKGKTANEVLLSKRQLRKELREAGFTSAVIEGAGGITFQYVDSAVARAILPLYNFYELVLLLKPLGRRLGTFLISSAMRGRGI